MAAHRRFSSALERNPTVALLLPPDAGRRVPLDLLVVRSDPKDQGEGSLPAVPGGGGLVALLGLLRQPLDDLIFADGIGRAGAEHRPKLIVRRRSS